MKASRWCWPIGVFAFTFAALASANAAESEEATASSSQADFAAGGVLDGNRFSAEQEHAWKGQAGQKEWWWQVRFAQLRTIGTILQIQGDQTTFLRNAPQQYVWQGHSMANPGRTGKKPRPSARRGCFASIA